MSVPSSPREWQIAECLLPGVTPALAEALARRVRRELAGTAGVSLVGSLLMTEDEVLLCVFAGPAGAVRAAAERAELPFERIVSCAGLGWPARLERDGPAATRQRSQRR
jgi:hypothetical protein